MINPPKTSPAVPVEPAWFKQHAAATVGSIAAVIVIIGAVIVAPVLRHREVEQLEKLVVDSSTQTAEALQNVSVYSGLPPEAYAMLADNAQALSRIHDSAVLASVKFARGKWNAALEYTDYMDRLGHKMKQVAESQRDAAEKKVAYDDAVQVLKGTAFRNRAAAQEDVNHAAVAIRIASELAYQQCALLNTLERQYPYVRSQAESAFASVGPDLTAIITAGRPRAEQETMKAHLLRKEFNPAARAPNS